MNDAGRGSRQPGAHSWRAAHVAALAVLVLGVILVASSASARADGEINVSLGEPDDSAFPEISVVVTADRAGRAVPLLRSDELRLSEGGKLAQVLSVRRAHDGGMPLTLVVTVDTSGSMEGASIQQAQAAAGALLQKLAPEDSAAVVAFSDQSRVVQAATLDRAATQRAVSGLVAVGNTALYDAVVESVRAAGDANRARRAVVLLSDGREFGGASRSTREQSLDAASRGGATFFMVGVGPDIDDGYLQEVATRSGGRFFKAAGAADVPPIYAALEELLRGQFVVTARSDAPASGAERTLSLDIHRADGTGHTERAYHSRRPAEATSAPPPPIATPAPVASVASVAATSRSTPVARAAATSASSGWLSWMPGWAPLAVAAVGGAALTGGLIFGVRTYIERSRRRRKSPVQLRALWRGAGGPDDIEVRAPGPRVTAGPRATVRWRDRRRRCACDPGRSSGASVPIPAGAP
ncbi:MAG: VWA domain-containing protein [Dehalococcoidia bacterium]